MRPAGPSRRSLQRAAFSFGAMWAGESATTVALAVVAFLDGGLAAVGIVTAVRMGAAALLTPVLGTVGDRVRRERVLTAIGLVRAVTLAAAGVVVAADGPAVLTYALAVVATVALAVFRPAHSALLPALASSPADLTSANAVRGMLDSLATLGGPVAAAALLAVTGPGVVFAVGAGASLLAGLAVVGLRYDPPPRAATAAPAAAGVVGGLTAIARDRTLALITALGVVQTFTRGALTVFVVVVAIDLLDLADPGVGVLNAAIGAGGVLGSLGAFALVRRGGFGTWFGVGVALFGAPVAVLGLLPTTATAVLLLGLVGVGNALIDVAAFTTLARTTDETVLVRVFASFEALLTLGVAAGGLVTPALVDGLGLRPAMVVVGLLAPLAVVAGIPAVRRLNRDLRVRDTDVATLRAVAMLRALPVATIEQLAARLRRSAYPPGGLVVEQGDPGDDYFVVVEGAAEVRRGGRVVNRLGPGDGFGEVALLADRPRTAQVRAAPDGPLTVAVLGRAAFLTAVTGYPVAASAGAGEVARIRARDAAADAE